jgi:NADH:ubiquinone oxidoreductase subunit K
MTKRKSTKDKLRSTKYTHKTKGRVTRTEVLLNGVHMTIIYITILTEDLLNGVHRTIIYLTILREVLLNGVHMTIIYITILTEDSWNRIQMTTIIIRLTSTPPPSFFLIDLTETRPY